MTYIRYTTAGSFVEHGGNGKLIPKPLEVIVELPYSEKNLQKAESKAAPGTLQVIEREDLTDLHQRPAAVQARICLADHATNAIYEIYVENGNLMMEVL